MDKQNSNTNSNKGQGVAEREAPTRSSQGGESSHSNSFAGLSKDEIRQKIEQLEHEWPIERILEVAGAAFLIANIFMNKNMRIKVQEMGDSLAELLGVENLSEWTPPAGLLKKLGISSQADIEEQLKKLKAHL